MKIIKLGFTGTRQGMSFRQIKNLIITLPAINNILGIYETHSGDCIGADAQFYTLVRRHLQGITTVGHIPDDDKYRAFCPYDKIMPALPYLERNKNIVIYSDMLIAAPKGYHEETRSGTWHTIRFARSISKPLIIIWPDAQMQRERLKLAV